MNAQSLSAVPHLTTAQNGAPHALEAHLLENQAAIEAWLRGQWRETPAPFYASVDLRNAGFKLAPVDTNLFPAGFNNLDPSFMPLCIQAVQATLERMDSVIRRVMIVPESHTRNRFYLQSLSILQEILEKAGCEVRLGSLLPELEDPQSITLESGREIRLEPLERVGDRVGVGDFDPDLVLLNNDLSSGIPPILDTLTQTVTPLPHLGWSTRLKSTHFQQYHEVVAEFGAAIDIDPWLIEPLFSNCGEVNFMDGSGMDCLTGNIEDLLGKIGEKYAAHGIKSEPFCILKADAGTYGMGVMTVRSPADLQALNRKQRSRMSKTKEGMRIENVIIQEGVYTFETWGEGVAEPVVYMIGNYVVGGFYRVHTERSVTENLNAPGMHFEPLAFAKPCNAPERAMSPDACPNRFYAYGVIARLGLLAAAREMAEE